MLHIVVVGTGWWGMELGKAAKALPGKIELLGCTSLAKDECARFVNALGGRVLDSYDAALADPSVDAVLLATPHSLHAAQIIAAANAGKHVFCEKPFTLSVASGAEAIAACERNKVVLAVGHNRRYMPGVRQIKQWVDAGELGTILHVEANYSSNLEGRYPPGHWRRDPQEIPCAGLTPMGLHMIDTLTWMLGPIRRVVAIAKHRALSMPLDDTCAALFELDSGATGTFGTHLACGLTANLRIYGSKANVDARDNFCDVWREPTDSAQPRTHHRYTVDDSLLRELEALADACAGKAPFPVKPAEALRNIAVLEAMRTSAAEANRWVEAAKIDQAH